jgi:ATP-dependent DNA helicase RecQ
VGGALEPSEEHRGLLSGDRQGGTGRPARGTLLFYSYADVAQQLKFIDEASPDRRELLTAKLDRMKRYAEARSCRRRILLSYFGETLDTDCGHCDVCEDPPDTFDGTIIAQKLLSAVLRTRNGPPCGSAPCSSGEAGLRMWWNPDGIP